MTQDLPTAYTIFSFLEQNYSKAPGLPAGMMKYVKKTKMKISKKLGSVRTKRLDSMLNTFDFSTFAPRDSP